MEERERRTHLVTVTVSDRAVVIWHPEGSTPEIQRLLRELAKLGVEARVVLSSRCG